MMPSFDAPKNGIQGFQSLDDIRSPALLRKSGRSRRKRFANRSCLPLQLRVSRPQRERSHLQDALVYRDDAVRSSRRDSLTEAWSVQGAARQQEWQRQPLGHPKRRWRC